MMRERNIGIACGVIALTWFASAGSAVAAQTGPSTKPEAKLMTRAVIDEAGRHVNLPVKVNRIVSLAPNLTEIVYALGAEDRLVGVSDYSEHPAAAKEKPHIGLPANPSVEAIVEARPDLVLVTTSINRRETADTLARLGIAVYATDPHSVEGMLDSITHIGEAIGSEAEAKTVIASLQKRLDALRARLAGAPAKSVLFVVWDDPLISTGNRTFVADAMRWAGGESVVHTTQNWPQVSMEEVMRLNPDYLVYAEGHSDAETDFDDSIAARLKELRGKPVWRNLAAVQEGHVAVISNEVITPAPGLVDAIEELARELHPEVFAQTPQPHAQATLPLQSHPEEMLCTR